MLDKIVAGMRVRYKIWGNKTNFEYGTVVRKSKMEGLVFVLYDGDTTAKSTYVNDLYKVKECF